MNDEKTLDQTVAELEDLAKKYEEAYPPKGSDADSDKDVMNKEPRKLSKEQIKEIDLIKGVGNSFHEMIDALPKGREMSLAKTKLEEAVMWAVKGVCNE